MVGGRGTLACTVFVGGARSASQGLPAARSFEEQGMLLATGLGSTEPSASRDSLADCRPGTWPNTTAGSKGRGHGCLPLGGRKLLCRFVPLGFGLKAVNARVAAVASPGNTHSHTAMKRTCHRWAADPLFGQHCNSGKGPCPRPGSSLDGRNLKQVFPLAIAPADFAPRSARNGPRARVPCDPARRLRE